VRVDWLAVVLRDAGLKVAEQPGWHTRGREMTGAAGVICHHTAGPARGNAPSLGIVTNGRSDLPGPLSQLVLGRDGTFYVVASGRANHAGRGTWRAVTDGNGRMIGIEAEATGRDGWPDVQMDAYRRGVAAILRRLGLTADACCGHKEYAQPKGRKPDPNFDMDAFRASVAAILRRPTTSHAATIKESDDMFSEADRALLAALRTTQGEDRARLDRTLTLLELAERRALRMVASDRDGTVWLIVPGILRAPVEKGAVDAYRSELGFTDVPKWGHETLMAIPTAGRPA